MEKWSDGKKPNTIHKLIDTINNTTKKPNASQINTKCSTPHQTAKTSSTRPKSQPNQNATKKQSSNSTTISKQASPEILNFTSNTHTTVTTEESPIQDMDIESKNRKRKQESSSKAANKIVRKQNLFSSNVNSSRESLLDEDSRPDGVISDVESNANDNIFSNSSIPYSNSSQILSTNNNLIFNNSDNVASNQLGRLLSN